MPLIVQPPGPVDAAGKGVPNYSQADAPGYGVYAQPFSAVAEALPAKSYSMDVLVDPVRFAAAHEATVRWAFDMRQTKTTKPWGYGFGFFGNHEGAWVPNAFKPVAVEKLTKWDVAWDADMRIGSGDASLLNDTFLKNAAGKSVLEVGVFGYASAAAQAFAMGSKSKLLGSVTIDGVAWSVYQADTFVMLLPVSPQLRHKMNLLPVRDFLKSKGALPAGAIFPSTAVGVEPAMGAGTCRIAMQVTAG